MTKVESVYSEKMKAPQLNILPSGIIGSTLKDKLHFPTGQAGQAMCITTTSQTSRPQISENLFLFKKYFHFKSRLTYHTLKRFYVKIFLIIQHGNSSLYTFYKTFKLLMATFLSHKYKAMSS